MITTRENSTQKIKKKIAKAYKFVFEFEEKKEEPNPTPYVPLADTTNLGSANKKTPSQDLPPPYSSVVSQPPLVNPPVVEAPPVKVPPPEYSSVVSIPEAAVVLDQEPPVKLHLPPADYGSGKPFEGSYPEKVENTILDFFDDEELKKIGDVSQHTSYALQRNFQLPIINKINSKYKKLYDSLVHVVKECLQVEVKDIVPIGDNATDEEKNSAYKYAYTQLCVFLRPRLEEFIKNESKIAAISYDLLRDCVEHYCYENGFLAKELFESLWRSLSYSDDFNPHYANVIHFLVIFNENITILNHMSYNVFDKLSFTTLQTLISRRMIYRENEVYYAALHPESEFLLTYVLEQIAFLGKYARQDQRLMQVGDVQSAFHRLCKAQYFEAAIKLFNVVIHRYDSLQKFFPVLLASAVEHFDSPSPLLNKGIDECIKKYCNVNPRETDYRVHKRAGDLLDSIITLPAKAAWANLLIKNGACFYRDILINAIAYQAPLETIRLIYESNPKGDNGHRTAVFDFKSGEMNCLGFALFHSDPKVVDYMLKKCDPSFINQTLSELNQTISVQRGVTLEKNRIAKTFPLALCIKARSDLLKAIDSDRFLQSHLSVQHVFPILFTALENANNHDQILGIYREHINAFYLKQDNAASRQARKNFIEAAQKKLFEDMTNVKWVRGDQNEHYAHGKQILEGEVFSKAHEGACKVSATYRLQLEKYCEELEVSIGTRRTLGR